MKLTAIIFAILLIILVTLANLGLGSSFYTLINFIPGGDKTGHFLLFGFMSYFLNSALNGKMINFYSIKVLKGSLILMLVITIEELSQYFIPSRTFSWLDLTASYLGVYIFGVLSTYRHGDFTIFNGRSM